MALVNRANDRYVPNSHFIHFHRVFGQNHEIRELSYFNRTDFIVHTQNFGGLKIMKTLKTIENTVATALKTYCDSDCFESLFHVHT